MSNLAITFLGAIALCNAAAFCAFGIDKWKAKRGTWRIPERSLALFALASGWPGALLAMRAFRHKTSKPSFKTKLGFAIAGNLALWAAAWHFGLLAQIFANPAS